MKARINPIYKICIQIRKLSELDFKELSVMATNQFNHSHPLKHKKASKIQALGRHNLKTIQLLEELRDHLQILPK